MTILGIETSCDETSAAIIRDGKLLSNVTSTQLFHSKYGGVVPEFASRAHQKIILPIVRESLAKANVTKEELNGVAAVYGPGLIGSLLVGLSFGKAYAFGLGIPFVGVNHMEAHILSNLIEEPKPDFPFINMTVSGGHTQLVLVKDYFSYQFLGETRDDAAGEAFDKVAKMLGLGYPGGPLIDKLARLGNPKAINFPRAFLDSDSFEFSFSGLKTSVLYYLKRNGLLGTDKLKNEDFLKDICASFQQAVIDVLVGKIIQAAKKFQISDVAIAGGVAANAGLRDLLNEKSKENNLRVFIPKFDFCTDNGAMVATAGYYRMKNGMSSQLELTAVPNLEFTS